MNERNRVIRTTTSIAGAAAVSITLLLPLGYFLLSYRHMTGNMEAEAEINSRIITELVNANPDLWKYEQVRLEELLSRRPADGAKETRRLLDLDGKTVAESVAQLPPPLLREAHDLKSAGVTVGRIEISRSLFRLLAGTGTAALVGLGIGLTVFVTLRILPLRAVIRAEEELRKLNESLELKVEERTRQLHETQEELVRKEKLAMLGMIAGNMGNELRNPLGVMNNAVYFLQTVMPDADEKVREYLEIIGKEIDNSQRIISDLTDFCQGRAPRTEPVAVHELIRQTRERCTIPENIRFQADLPETLPKILADPRQMEQVFQNLIANAVQAMPNGGSVSVSAQQVRGTRNEEENQERGTRYEEEQKVRGSRTEDRGNKEINLDPKFSILDPGFIEISVTDKGEGISPENMAKLFKPLFTTKSRGIGLGLAISQKLTEANGGRIEVESRLGEGTTFMVMLPVEGE